MSWELFRVVQDLEKRGMLAFGLDDNCLAEPQRWTAGLANKEAEPFPNGTVRPWFFNLQEDTTGAHTKETAHAIAAQQHKRYQPWAAIRHAWPLDLFRLLLDNVSGKTPFDELSKPHAKIFAMGSFYFPPVGYRNLAHVGYMLCIQTAEKKMNFEPFDDPETWALEPGREDYLLLMAAEPPAAPAPPPPPPPPAFPPVAPA